VCLPDFPLSLLDCPLEESNHRFGAFNPEGWSSDDDYRNNVNAFLYCWPNQGDECIKLEKIGGGEAAVFDYARSGPHFGADGLVLGRGQAAVTGLFAGPDTVDVKSAQGQLREATSRLGQSYANIPPSYQQSSLFGGDREWVRLREVKVYVAPELAALY